MGLLLHIHLQTVSESSSSPKRASQLQLAIVWKADDENFSNTNDFRLLRLEDYGNVSGTEFPEQKRLPGVEQVLAVLIEGRWIPIQILELFEIVNQIKGRDADME